MTTTTTEDIIRHLRDAKALLLRDGWHRGGFGSSDPKAHTPRCITQALSAVAGSWGESAAARSALRATPLPRIHALSSWNDWTAESIDDVIDLIDKTITRLEEQ